jgi:hypothetical protein
MPKQSSSPSPIESEFDATHKYAHIRFMRTTIDLPEPLFHRAKLLAVQRRVTLKKLITEVLETAFHEPVPVSRRMTSPPVPFEATGPLPALSNREISDLFEEEDLSKAGIP